jgi:hypothetical protein
MSKVSQGESARSDSSLGSRCCISINQARALNATDMNIQTEYGIFISSGSRQIHSEPTGVLRGKSAVCGLNGLLPTLRVGALHLNPRPRAAHVKPPRVVVCCSSYERP